jgi:MoaA/NifB/PqqE/SkfB family radical SAM enzyme
MAELLEFTALARAAGVPVYVQSNAIRWSQPHVLQQLVDAGIAGLLASYHSADPRISDDLTRAPGTHARTELGILAALTAGLHVDLNGIVDARTLPGLVARSERIVARFHGRGSLNVSFAFPTNYHDPAVYRASVAPLDLVAPVLSQAIAVLQAAGIRVAPIGSCGFPLCTLRDLPAVIDLEQTADLAAEHTAGRTHPPTCLGCAVRSVCNGPRREYLDVHGERGLVPFTHVPEEFATVLGRDASPHAPAATPEHVARLLAEASSVTTVEQSGQVEIQLGHFCNNRCVFCASGQLTELGAAVPVADAAVARALDAAAGRGLTRVTFLGGEPTIQDSFLPSLAHARRVGLRDITVFTNGSRTWDVRFLDAVLAGGPVQWRISIQGGDAASHDAIVVKKGAFERIVKGLKLLQERGQDVTVNMCLTTDALPALAQLAQLVVEHGVRQLCIDMVRPVSTGDRTEAWLRGIMPRFTAVVPQLRALLKELDRLAPGFDVNLTHVPFCVLPDEAHRLHHGGEPTVTFTADLAERQGAMDKYAFQASDRRLMPQCEACVFRPRCTGVPHAYLDAHGDAEFVPIDPRTLADLDPLQHAMVDGLMPALARLRKTEALLDAVVADPRMRRVELRHRHGALWLLPSVEPVPAGLWPMARAARWQMALQPGLATTDLLATAARIARVLDAEAQVLTVDVRRGAMAQAWIEAALRAWQGGPAEEFRLTSIERRWAAVTVRVQHRGRTARVQLQPQDDAERPIGFEVLDLAEEERADLTALSRWLGHTLRAVR